MVREEKFLPHFQSPTVAFKCLLVLTRFAVHNSKIIQRVGYSWMQWLKDIFSESIWFLKIKFRSLQVTQDAVNHPNTR